MYRIVYTKQADRTLRKLPRNISDLIRGRLDEMAVDPLGSHNNVTRLVGRSEYRLRDVDWRALYELRDDKLILLAIKIRSRGEVYR
ncbi:MAG: type II toxin-antitoxin system RelE/ParE family toxin [Caldilineaceae bacterium]|nr:type II toxin-antitoxin system RelE/ParE family toxin [Caldilineaceae bacterium]